MWKEMFLLAAGMAGFLVALVLAVDIMPKVHSECKLPMPALPSYLFGHAREFLDTSQLLRRNMAWFRELGEVFQIWIVHSRVVVTANPADVKQILGSPEIFARPAAQIVLFNDLAPENFQTMPRELHKVHRARLRDVLSPKTLRAMHKVVSRVARDLVDRLQAAGAACAPVNVTPHLADTTFQVLLEAGLGSKMPATERAQFMKDSHALLTELLAEYFTYPLRRMLWFTGIRRRIFRQNRIVRAAAAGLLRARKAETPEERAARAEDILDVIRELSPDYPAQQVCHTVMFCIAGFESSSEALAWAIYEVASRPSVLVQIRMELADVVGDKPVEYDDVAKLTYLQCVWKETLRLHPASGLLLRRAKKDATLPGSRVFIPAGVQVGALIAGAHRHPGTVPDADAFLPERWMPGKRGPAGAFAPFSCGPERCPGQSLGNHEGVVILAEVYRALDIELACNKEDVVGISDWTERARGPDPEKGAGDLSWTIPVRVSAR